MSTSRCKSCGQQIEWYRTVKGHNIPLDPLPIAGGNVLINQDGLVEIVKPDPDVIRSVSHFMTCVDATQHRRRNR